MVSVIVPVYNAGPYLFPCLESIAAQSWHKLEVILVEDSSTDDSRAQCRAFCERDDRFSLLTSEEKLGPAGARRMGLEASHGDFIGFVDCDDLIHPEMMGTLRTAILESGLPAACCRYAAFPSGEVPENEPAAEGWEALRAPAHLHALLKEQRVDYSLCNKLYRREILSPEKFETNVSHNEDLLINWRVLQHQPGIAFADFVGYHYRQHNESASHKPLSCTMVQQQLKVAQTIVADAGGTPLDELTEGFYYEKLLYLHSMILRQPPREDLKVQSRALQRMIGGNLRAALHCRQLSLFMKLVALFDCFGGPLYRWACVHMLKDRQS